MSLYITQICDACGQTRSLQPNEALRADLGGWRTLNIGNQSATLCSYCVGLVVTHALERVKLRHAPGVDEDSKIANLGNFSLHFPEQANKGIFRQGSEL